MGDYYAVMVSGVATWKEAENAFQHGAGYDLGIGAMFPTPQKTGFLAAHILSHIVWAFKMMTEINGHKVHSRHSRSEGDPRIYRGARGRYPRRCHRKHQRHKRPTSHSPWAYGQAYTCEYFVVYNYIIIPRCYAAPVVHNRRYAILVTLTKSSNGNK
jgi:hypothetical protein